MKTLLLIMITLTSTATFSAMAANEVETKVICGVTDSTFEISHIDWNNQRTTADKRHFIDSDEFADVIFFNIEAQNDEVVRDIKSIKTKAWACFEFLNEAEMNYGDWSLPVVKVHFPTM